MSHLDDFADGFILTFTFPLKTVARVSGYLDQLGKRLAAWLLA